MQQPERLLRPGIDRHRRFQIIVTYRGKNDPQMRHQ